jgi:hypothetical protein
LIFGGGESSLHEFYVNLKIAISATLDGGGTSRQHQTHTFMYIRIELQMGGHVLPGQQITWRRHEFDDLLIDSSCERITFFRVLRPHSFRRCFHPVARKHVVGKASLIEKENKNEFNKVSRQISVKRANN